MQIRRRICIAAAAPYCPEMNGIAERVNRMLTEHASAMLWTATLPIGFWAPAILMATFLKNQSPTRALTGMTPYEAYYGCQPNQVYTHLRKQSPCRCSCPTLF